MLKEQLLWEQECLNRGSEAYFSRQDKTREQGNELTDATKYVLRDRIHEIADAIREDCKNGQRGKNAAYNKLVRHAAGEVDGQDGDYMKVAYIGLQYLLVYLGRGKKVKVSKFVGVLGSKMEAELKCRMFEAEMPAYFNTVMKSFKEQGVTSAIHMQKVMMKKFSDFDLQWTDWTTPSKAQVGARVFRNILACMGDLIFLQKKLINLKTDFFIDTTVAFDDWMGEFERERGLLLPMSLPLKVPPVPWENQNSGGYYSPHMKLPFVKSRGKDARAYIEAANPEMHRKAVNKLQRTAWEVNKDVLKVQEEIFRRNLRIGMPSSQPIVMTPFPEHLVDIDKQDYTPDEKLEVLNWKTLRKRQYDEERKRKGKVISFRQSHLLAKELAGWDEFYFAYNCDFRGRIYCATSGLSPQGADDGKGLLRFKKSVKLGKEGIKWLAVQGANTFGEDKLSYEDRHAWVVENKVLIESIVNDPISNRQWGKADKPYQFLAFCFEWAACDYGNNPEYKGHLAVGLDGSCNGLQHFSAMLRDEVGAKATNLVNSEKPEDIYGDVAKVTTEKLKVMANLGNAYAKIWLQVGIDRKIAKKPVMTLPYGATQQSARASIYEFAVENWSKFNMDSKHQWELAKFLTPIMWAAIGEVVIAARAAMTWLQKNVGDNYCNWKTIIGFPVYQHYRIENLVVVSTQLEGKVQLRCPDHSLGVSYKTGQRNGIAPNFVHSIDSTHMVLTINACDLHSYAMIHDDFGTHAGNTGILFNTIRKTFRHLYANTDPLRHWAKQVGVSTAGLPRGTYDIEEILNAKYFFG